MLHNILYIYLIRTKPFTSAIYILIHIPRLLNSLGDDLVDKIEETMSEDKNLEWMMMDLATIVTVEVSTVSFFKLLRESALA